MKYTSFIAYPLIYKPIITKGYSSKRIWGASLPAAIIGLQLGAFGVVLETLFSGKTELPFGTFVLLMQPIHLAIGVVESLVVAAVVTFVWKQSPGILEKAALGGTLGNISVQKVIAVFALAAMIAGGALSWFASANPDGLEWSMFKTVSVEELEAPDGLHQTLAKIQTATAFLPDYNFKIGEKESESGAESDEMWPAVSGGTTAAGIVGAGLTLALVVLIGFTVGLVKKKRANLTV